MNAHDIRKLFPNASRSLLDANASGANKAPKLEHAVKPHPLAAAQGKESGAGGFFIRVVSVRKRLLDEDNLSEKYLVDCLRYAEIIEDDNAKTCQIETTQRKCEKGEAEHTVVEVYRTPEK